MMTQACFAPHPLFFFFFFLFCFALTLLAKGNLMCDVSVVSAITIRKSKLDAIYHGKPERADTAQWPVRTPDS